MGWFEFLSSLGAVDRTSVQYTHLRDDDGDGDGDGEDIEMTEPRENVAVQ